MYSKCKNVLPILIIVFFLFCSVFNAYSTDIGAYYFPGWKSSSKYWRDLKGLPDSRSPGKSWPDRKPLLGYYPEEELWVAEKHIEWASSYGIKFFAYDWYWNAKGVSLNHAIDNYLKAKNKNKLKFMLLWCNHQPYSTSNLETFSSMVDYWLQNYFANPQYMKLDGKPIVLIFSPQELRDNAARFGKTSKELLNLAREKAIAKGYKGIYFVGSAPASPYWVEDYLPNNDFDAITAYDYYWKPTPSGKIVTGKEPKAVNYAELTEGYKSNWEWILTNSKLPYFVPISAGWDSRPWGSNTEHDNCFSTPKSFKQMLLAAKTTMEKYPDKTKRIGIITAWNEFGEGNYIEPTKKWGFQYLQSVLDVFGK